ncbi:P110/LppT family adhesin N-terminal domain [Mycoplasma sp. 'Moose RK']|uniref:P110/LppT family adhesin N-terminal domain n=1 Tax=Mycoplasma sp. 'Moose RK' TaxID=2780095 RepID=UPI0018C2E50A|nr:P110/LppT family adhesin N-terminal domain [Mycoplasma sp. 'Moose RK']MBG0730960.1 P110/LppT family adhesin N-terminal domain [Mycoplasma sp. 'Moose RK']
MKKLTLKQILLTTLGISAIAGVAITIPLAISLSSKNFDQKLKEFAENKSSAKNLKKFTFEDRQQIEELAKKLQPKSKFSERLDAYEALNLHFDKSYNFNLNDAVDFSELKEKFPNLIFKILVPESSSTIKINQNIIKDLPLSITNVEKTVNFVTKINLDFSKKLKNFQFTPENLSATISLSKLDFLRNKTATEIALLFYKDFYENYKESKDSKKALFKTFSKFGGISLNLGTDSLVILPSNYEIKPDLQLEKLVFSNVDDFKKTISLNMILFDKKTSKSTNFSLKFVDFPNENYETKFAEIFSQSFVFNPEISKYLAKKKKKLKPIQIIQKKPSDLNVESNFATWFHAKPGKGSAAFLNEIKPFLSNFVAKKIIFKLGQFQKNQTKNDNLIPINLEIYGNFLKSLNIPAGVKLNSDSEYIYNFSLNFDASHSIYSSYLKNASENFGSVAVKNPEKLNFELKKDLPIRIFASTIDDTIKQFFNKPLDLKNITKTAEPLFELLNFSTESKEKPAVTLETIPPVAPKSPMISNASTTLFEEKPSTTTSSENSTPPVPSAPTVPTPKPQQKLGDYLKSFFEDLAKRNFPTNIFIYLSSSFNDKYTLQIELKENKNTFQKFEVIISNVLRDNVAYKELTDNTKTYLFLDWQTNVESWNFKNKDNTVIKRVSSISSINNPNLKFTPGRREPKTWFYPETKPFINEKGGGIYLTDSGFDLKKDMLQPKTTSQNPPVSTPQTAPDDLKLKFGKTFVYVFKPTDKIRPASTKYFLLKSNFKPGEKFADISFGLLIQSYDKLNSTNSTTNLIGYGSEATEKPNYTHSSDSQNNTIFKLNSQLQSTFNDGKTDIKVKPDATDISPEPKNSVEIKKDFLSNPDATIMLVVTIEKNEKSSTKNTQILKFSFYSSEHRNGLEPLFEWNQEIKFGLQVDLSKNLTIGTTKTVGEKWPEFDKTSSLDQVPKGGITFKALALFDKPQTKEAFNKIIRKFHDQYFAPSTEK